MPNFIDWVDDKKKSTFVLVSILLISYVTLFLVKAPWIAILAAIASIICPFALFLVWIIDTAWVKKLLDRRWTGILIGGGFVVYGMIAHTYASSLINDYFKVDPTHFTITSVFLTTVYLLVGIFLPFVMEPLGVTTLLIGLLVIPALTFMATGMPMIKRIGLLFVAAILTLSSSRIYAIFQNRLPLLAEQVALRADFNEKHRCTAKWPVDVDKVVFLHDGNVLAHISGTRNYEIFPCLQMEGSSPVAKVTLRDKTTLRP